MTDQRQPEPKRTAIQIRVSASDYQRIRAAALAERRAVGNYCALKALDAVKAWEVEQ